MRLVVGDVQPFGGGVEVGENLNRIGELNREANLPDGQ